MRLVEGAFRQAFQEQARALLPHFHRAGDRIVESQAHYCAKSKPLKRHIKVCVFADAVERPGQGGDRHLIVAP